MDIKQKVLEENAKLHDKFAKFHTRAVPYQSRFITKRYIWSLIKEQLRLNNIDPKNKKVLEVACGTGTFIDLFKKLKVSSYEGMDLSKEMIKYAKINHPNTNFYNSSLEDFYKKHKNEYDIIISASFLHHLHDLEDGLKQIKSMLTKNGIYIAIHEEINHKWSSIEIFDNDLSLLLGYQEAASYSIIKRLKVFFKKYNPLKLIKLIIKKNKYYDNNYRYKEIILFSIFTIYKSKRKLKHSNISNVQNNNNIIDNINYVDYQLNFNFDLSKNEVVKKYGKVIPYCYYNFIEFKLINNKNNHHMFVMINKG